MIRLPAGPLLRPGLVLATAITLLLAADLVGQHSIRGYGRFGFDSALRDVSDYVQVVAASRRTYALRSNGQVVAWGNGAAPVASLPMPATKIAGSNAVMVLLMDGSIVDLSQIASMQPPPAGPHFIDISAGYLIASALRTDGQITAWGDATYGANNVPGLPAGVTYVALDSTAYSHLALRSDGNVTAWGDNRYGQCNVAGLPSGMTYVAVAAGDLHCLALRSDGNVVGWGDNTYGQTSAPALPPGTTYTSVAAGGANSMALRSDGQLVVWGVNHPGLMVVPALPPGVSYVACDVYDLVGCGLRSDGRIECWGDNRWLACNLSTPVNGRPVQVDGGEGEFVALFADGTLRRGGFDDRVSLLPPLPPGLSYTHVETDSGSVVGVRSDGSVVSTFWAVPTLPPGLVYVDANASYAGNMLLRSDGQIEIAGRAGLAPVPALPPGVTYVEIDAGIDFMALRSDGQAVAWGGINHTVPPPPSGLVYVSIATGSQHSLGLLSDGTIAHWTTRVNQGPTAPAPALPPGVSYVEIAAGYNHSVARRSDGTIVAWDAPAAWTPSKFNGTVVEQSVGTPGLSYLGVGAGDRITLALVGPASTYVTVANGCAGSLPTTRLIPRDTPRLGKDLQLTLFDLPANLAFITVGFSNTMSAFGPLPFDAAVLGMPGCTLHSSTEVVVPISGANHQARFVLPIPSATALVGVGFYQQAVVFDPQAGNAAGFVLSNATAARIGH